MNNEAFEYETNMKYYSKIFCKFSHSNYGVSKNGNWRDTRNYYFVSIQLDRMNISVLNRNEQSGLTIIIVERVDMIIKRTPTQSHNEEYIKFPLHLPIMCASHFVMVIITSTVRRACTVLYADRPEHFKTNFSYSICTLLAIVVIYRHNTCILCTLYKAKAFVATLP